MKGPECDIKTSSGNILKYGKKNGNGVVRMHTLGGGKCTYLPSYKMPDKNNLFVQMRSVKEIYYL